MSAAFDSRANRGNYLRLEQIRKTIFSCILARVPAKEISMLRFGRLLPALLVWLAAGTVAQAQQQSEQEIDGRIDALLGRMTLEEKAGQLAQFSGINPQILDMV